MGTLWWGGGAGHWMWARSWQWACRSATAVHGAVLHGSGGVQHGMGSIRHRLLTAGDDHLRVAATNGLICQHDGLDARTADTVDRCAGRVL